MTPYRCCVLETLTKFGTTLHLAIERFDGEPICCGWDELQAIKNEFLGEDCLAIEIFPPTDTLVNEVNRRHLWAFPQGVLPENLLCGS